MGEEEAYLREEIQAKIEQERKELQRNKDPHIKKMLKDLEDEESITNDKVHKENLQWEIKMMKQAMRQFPKIESLYEAHKQTTLPLLLL